MNDKFDELKNLWETSRKDVVQSPTDVSGIITIAEKKKRSTIKTQALNILVLLITLAGIAAFFFYVARFNNALSHIGAGLMMGGLALRILIECYSIYLSAKIDLSQPSVKANDAFSKFYQFRKKIHGPVTITILVLYTIGFYMLTPEFSLYFSLPVLVLIDLSYVVAAVIFTLSIRNGIRKEMAYLDDIRKVQQEMLQP